MKLIMQRGAHDCGVAAAAMACDASYDDILDLLSPEWLERLSHSGLSHYDMFEILWQRGHRMRYLSKWNRLAAREGGGGKSWKSTERTPWPPVAFAPAHIVQIPGHWMAMDEAGQVFCPSGKVNLELTSFEPRLILGVFA